jgi:hypothetical protein
MKRTLLAFILFTLLFVLVACGGANTTTATAPTSLSSEGQLLVGTIKLESTDLAISSTQAATLLPLWETLQSLSTSGTAATEEVQAVVDQIKSSMSAQQISSITAMNLTPQDLATALTAIGAASNASSSTTTTAASSLESQPGSASGAPAGGGNPGGGNPPSDQGAATGGSAGVVQTVSTQAVTNQSPNLSNQVPAALINALVDILKKKIT